MSDRLRCCMGTRTWASSSPNLSDKERSFVLRRYRGVKRASFVLLHVTQSLLLNVCASISARPRTHGLKTDSNNSTHCTNGIERW
jgi:hypothetical protein